MRISFGRLQGAFVAVVLAALAGGAAARGPDVDSTNKGNSGGDVGAAPKSEFLTGTLAFDKLRGKWCGEQGDYSFTEKKLNVARHSDGKKYFLPIEKINFGDGWIELHFDKSGNKNTVFYEFAPDGTSMAQAANTGGDNGPKMRFRRC